jgi:hypothetical protein
MSLEIHSDMPVAAADLAQAADRDWLETTLLAGGSLLALALFSILSVLLALI